MEKPEIQILELIECNNIEPNIQIAQQHGIDIENIKFKGCYEAHIETQKLEFNMCEFDTSICLNSKFNQVTFNNVVFNNCDFSKIKVDSLDMMDCIFNNWHLFFVRMEKGS